MDAICEATLEMRQNNKEPHSNYLSPQSGVDFPDEREPLRTFVRLKLARVMLSRPSHICLCELVSREARNL